MIMSSLLLLLLLCSLSLHACNARHLGLVDDKTSSRNAYLSSKDVEKANLDQETPIPILEELGTQKQRKVEIETNESWGGAIINTKALLKGGATSGLGHATIVTHSQKDLQLVAKIEEWRQGRSMVGWAADNGEEESEVVEDIVVMDYAQPHRKPPIHNEKP